MKKTLTKAPYTEQQVNLIRNTVARGATEDELKLFLYTAARTGLDPITHQIHFVKRGRDMTIQTGIDGYRAIAERKGDLAGIEDAIYDTEDAEHPGKATVTVWRLVDGHRVSFTASARWNEYAPQGAQSFMWNKMPYLMLAKCAEALALRKAFPNDLSGLYTDEEMQQADGQGRKAEALKNEGEEVPAPSEKEKQELEEDLLECYCTLCGEQGVKGRHGYYCPNYKQEDHKSSGRRNWKLIGGEEKKRRQEEANQILVELEQQEEKTRKQPSKQKQKEKEPF
jgi:phage recombination protein Bet